MIISDKYLCLFTCLFVYVRLYESVILDSNTYYPFAKNSAECWWKLCHTLYLFVRLPTIRTKKLVSIDGKLLEDSNGPKIVKIGAIQSQFGQFFENPKFGKNEHWYYGTLVLETKITYFWVSIRNHRKQQTSLSQHHFTVCLTNHS